MRLSELGELRLGEPRSRLDVEEVPYSLEDFGNDLDGLAEKTGNLVLISNSLQQACQVDALNKALTNNMMLFTIDTAKLDPKYFVYLFNENRVFAQAKQNQMQGSTNVQRLSLANVRNFEVALPALEIQRQIGLTYAKLLKLQAELFSLSGLYAEVVLNGLEEKVRLLNDENTEGEI